MNEKCHGSQSDGECSNGNNGIRKIAIVGLANAGKSILFNQFTKTYSMVANYPQTTTHSVREKTVFAGRESVVIDTPGISSLNATTGDEQETRDILIKQKPDMIIFCGDATHLKRTLVLLSEIKELGIPVVFCLNKVDDALKKGLVMDVKKLSMETNMPVVETSAVHGIGLKKLEEAAKRASANGNCVRYSDQIEQSLKKLQSIFPAGQSPSKGELLLLLGGDTSIKLKLGSAFGGYLLPDINSVLKKIYIKTSAVNLRQAVFNTRDSWAGKVADEATSTSSFTFTGFSRKAAWFARHPVFGWPVLLGLLWLTFTGVGTIANELAGFMDDWIFVPLTGAISAMIAVPFLHEFLLGDFGILTMGVMNAIVTVVPILIVFFLIVHFLEDVGYLPNLSVLTNRALAIFGLTGKSVLPLTLGFGCNTMATLTSRVLETKKERIIISFLIALGVPCSVQLGVMLAIMATAPFSTLLIVLSTVVATQIVCGLIIERIMPAGRKSDFILELPDLRMPNWRNIVRKTYIRIKMFLEEALPLFVLAAAMMFVLEKTGLLDVIKTIFRPIITGFLSLPDKVTEVFILVLSRREVGAVYFKDMFEAGEVDYYQTIVGLVVMTLFIPCISNTMVMVKELGMRWAVAINTSIIFIAILVGGALNYVLRIF